jgi:EpsI family protein
MRSIFAIMRKERSIAVAVFLVAQAGLAYSIGRVERIPSPPDLAHFPSQFQFWKLLGEEPVAGDVQDQLRADRILSRNYAHLPDGRFVNLFTAWFESQLAGARQPHSPKVCLPGSGWTSIATDELRIETAAGPISVNRYIVSKAGLRAIVLYWYQTPQRVIAGEWAAKVWTVYDALRENRSDVALVRIVVWCDGAGDGEAKSTAALFAQDAYPLLRDRLPH